MSKVICDICGTSYPETADSCPICGFNRYPEIELTEEDLLMDEPLLTRNKGGRYEEPTGKRKNKEIFDYDQVNPEEEEEEEDTGNDTGEEEYEEAPKSGVGLVIVLVIVIMLLMAVVGFVFFRFFLPTFQGSREVTEATTEPVVTEAPETEPTTEPTVPCTDLILNEAPRSLNKEGQFYLLNVKVLPEDTTDILMYVSGDEAVCTVTEGGRIVATGEGETTVYITCGNQQINCPVIVKYEEETEPVTDPTLPLLEEGTTGEDTEQATGEENGQTEAVEETEAPEETAAPDVELKLKAYDKSISVGYGFTLELDCDLDPSQVEWSVEHGYIASVDEKGFVLAKARGTTAVIVKYGDQEVQCIIRCK